MKNSLLPLLLLALMACTQTPKETVETGEALPAGTEVNTTARQYLADTESSSLRWTGSEGLASIVEDHYGFMPISSGIIRVEGQSFSGSFEVAVAGLTVTDITKESSNKKLTDHLLGADFLDAGQFPTASFEIVETAATATDSIAITGNLTMKGVTKSITFPALVTVADSAFSAKSAFYINRKDWNMHYRTEQSLGDKLIRPEVLLEINLVAKPQV
jgi:polyisoprenoid-binding protein YceI